MPVSVCDPARDALLERTNSNENTCDRLDRQLVASAKRVLMTHIEYEETGTYQTNNLEALRCKYVILNQNKKTQGKESGNGSIVSKGILLPEPNKILFPQEAIQLGWQNNRQWNVGAGMINVGNTCYLNSTLQALFHVPSLANWLANEISHCDLCENNGGGQGGCIICAMSKTLLASQNTSGPIKPWLVYSKLRLVCRHLIPGRQEDAHEFLRYLVEAMEKSYLTRFKGSKDLDQYSKETTPLNRILGGYLRSTVRCLSCGHMSVTFQHFQDLLLDIRKVNTLDEALECYFARERLEDMGYRCESCKCKVSATKQFSLERPPSVLCIQLKRFSMMGNKINKHIAFNSKLDLSKFLCKNSTTLSYRLVAMVTHIGSSQNCGHYTAIGQCSDGSYYQFDDSLVCLLPLHSVLATNAYIMLYELEKSATLISRTITPSTNSPMSNSNGSTEVYNDKKNFIPLLKSLPGSMADIKIKKPESKGFIGPILPFECLNFNQRSNKILINDKNRQNINHIVQKNENKMLVTSGSKLVQQNQARSLLSEETNIHKKKINLLSYKNPSTINDMNNIKITSQIQTENIKQIQHLKTNGYKNNTSTSNQNIISLVPYDGSDESEIDSLCNNKKQEIIIDTKATMPHWKVSSTKDKVLLSPSLRGEAGWTPKKIINKSNENSLITNGSFNNMRQLLHMSQQEYSVPVTTWNGGRSRLEKETTDGRRKRPVDELDHGHTKKVKSFTHHNHCNQDYNLFQEYRNSHSWNHGRFSFKNNHRNMSHSRHRRVPYRGRHKSYHNYHRH